TNNVTVAHQPTAEFTFTNVCFGTTTGFTDLSNGNGGIINQWSWDFTNNGVVDNTTQNPTNGYTAAGSYTVELLVTTTTGCKDSVTMVVPVDPIPVANFSGTNECLGNNTTFIDSSNVSTGSIASWAWNFGDGIGTSVAPSPTYTYASAGTYNVTLTVTSDSGCISNYNRNIQVYANPVANFSTDTACNTSATSFTDLTAIGSTAIQTWGWDFDNNGSADDNEQNPSFVFSGAGTYPVNLAVVDTFGCVHDTTINVTVSENPIANYTYSNECYGAGTVFTDLSNNNGGTTPIDTWEWDYDGNGTIDNTTQSPTYTFPAAGTYQTELFVTSALGCKDSVTIAVVVNPIPVANFSAANACLNFVTTFIDSSTISTGAISSWAWDFGNGVGTSVIQNPTYIYPASGTFNVSLTVTSDSGCTHNVVIPVTVNPKPTADFNVNNVCLNLAAPFTDASLGNGGTINQWAWDFTNNGSVDNTTQNPTNFYATAGTFNVQLVATTTNGCKDTIVKPVTIHPMPDADFTFVNQCVSANVPFTDNSVVSTGTITVWDWKFGDGQSSMIQSPTHLYASQGIYNVQLIVTTNNNCSDTIAKNNIEVWPLPNVNFGPTSVCLNNLTQFVDSSTVSNSFTTNTNTQWSWNFGDGIGVSALQNPMYMYGSDGVFNATLIVTTNHNCVDSITKPVTVHPLPVVDFTPNIVSGCTPVCVTFTDNTVIGAGSTITQWNWDFTSDGIKDASSQNPMYCFTNPSHSSVRDYSIRLIATSNFGCKDTLTKVNYIHSNPIPLASFSYWPNDEASIVDNDITFTDQSIIASTWDWELGDGATSNVQHPVHEYTDTGFYLVVLRIENEYGCRDTTQKIVNIKPIYAIWIPNAFTPNGDFSNDFFYVDGYGIKELQVKIFDRWGLKIYDEIGVDQSWDGTYNGNIVQTDVYVYKVRAKDIFDEWHDYIGKVTVIK
ncbi:MAG: PKD domain-containing protein, partial [Flavobacteriales bacterium]|nr:PKD domain-containing protein [Flavobacteriales bacterium]